MFIEAVREPTKPMPAYLSKAESDAELADSYCSNGMLEASGGFGTDCKKA